MANMIFSKDELIEGEYEGQPFRFRVLKDGEMGAASIYGPAQDLIANKKVFLKKYIDPAPRCEWFQAFVDYQKEVQSRVEDSPIAQQVIVGIDSYFQHIRGRFWQAIEFVENSRDLKNYLESGEITWDQRRKFARIFMYAMNVLHQELHLAHTDLKPANLLLIPIPGGEYGIKLIDFDRPVLLDVDEIPWAATEGYLGSPGYYSPEHRKGCRPTDKSDIFTCGLILYELLTKEGHPFQNESVPQDYAENTAPLPHLIGSFGSCEADQRVAEILHRTLEPNPASRPSADEIREVLLARTSGARPVSQPQPATAPIPTSVSRPTTTSAESQKTAADIVFLLDATGSMGPCLEALKDHIHDFIRALVNGSSSGDVAPVEDWRARVVGYRDFIDCNVSESVARAYRMFGNGGWYLSNPFTRDENELHAQLDDLKPFGGGRDPSESLLDALMLVMKSGYLPHGQANASDPSQTACWRSDIGGRFVIVFTDAGYHPQMSYDSNRTRFEERETHPFDLTGAGLDEIQSRIENGFFKVYLFAPSVQDYEEFSDLSNVVVMASDEAGGGLVKTVGDRSKFEQLIEGIVKGVSRSSSDIKEIVL